MKVIVAPSPEQTVVLPEMVTVGGGVTVTVTAPVAGTEQPGVPPVATLTKVNVVDVVNVDEIVALPLASSTMVWLPLPVV